MLRIEKFETVDFFGVEKNLFGDMGVATKFEMNGSCRSIHVFEQIQISFTENDAEKLFKTLSFIERKAQRRVMQSIGEKLSTTDLDRLTASSAGSFAFAQQLLGASQALKTMGGKIANGTNIGLSSKTPQKLVAVIASRWMLESVLFKYVR